MKLYAPLVSALLATGIATPALAAPATFLTGTPYTQFDDSPFAAFASGNPNFFLEDFEDGALSTPGALASVGFVVGPGETVDSVDGDDGVLDGNGNAGHSWYSSGDASTISFVFGKKNVIPLPTHVGIVWTDVGTNGPGAAFGFDNVILRAFDSTGTEIGSVVSPNLLGDGLVTGGTAEDFFFGVIFDGGIAKISLSSINGALDWEVDHLQYGSAAPVPLPGAAWMLAPVLAGLVSLRRKRV